MSKYWELLRDPRWQKKRLEVMEKAGFACQHCDSKTKTLNVHHGYYAKGKMPWEYEIDSLECLCEECHESFQEVKRIIDLVIGIMGTINYSRTLGYLMGMYMETNSQATANIIDYEMALGIGDAWQFTAEEIIDISTLNNGSVSAHILDEARLKKIRG